jgi:hypothetical protein
MQAESLSAATAGVGRISRFCGPPWQTSLAGCCAVWLSLSSLSLAPVGTSNPELRDRCYRFEFRRNQFMAGTKYP